MNECEQITKRHNEIRKAEFSRSWLTYLKPIRNLFLPVQDGMDVLAVGSLLSSWSGLGIFLGGTTEYKLRTMYGWGMVAHSRCRPYHVGRVNTLRRIRLAAEAGADSIDGTSATMYSCNVAMLDSGVRQPSLLKYNGHEVDGQICCCDRCLELIRLLAEAHA